MVKALAAEATADLALPKAGGTITGDLTVGRHIPPGSHWNHLSLL